MYFLFYLIILINYFNYHRYLSTVAIAAWYGRKYELAIFATAISSLLGWPFASLLG
jgi:alpha-1,2-mannosyltransferase